MRASSNDALSTRIRVDSAFSTLDLKPRGLPESAVVFIRTLRDPLPGLIPRDLIGGVPDAWSRAVAAAIDELTRRAARPALEVVAADAAAVLFLDRSELLACLAADWCHGRAISRWWWQSLFRATDIMSAVVNEWLTSIQYAPAAFAKLARDGDALPFARALPANNTRILLDEIIRHFGLAELAKSVSESKLETKPREPRRSDPALRSESTVSELLSPGEASRLRTQLAPEAFVAGLKQSSRVLLAIALMLERAPSLLRERGFGARLLQSLAAPDTPKVSARVDIAGGQQDGPIQKTHLPAARAENAPQPPAASSRLPDETRATAFSSATEIESSDYRVQRDDSYTPAAEGGDAEPAGVLQRDAGAAPDRMEPEPNPSIDASNIAEAHRAAVALEAPQISETIVTAASIELAIETKMGGVLYLINAALALELYSDFTRPLEPGIELSIWDFLALTGRELIGRDIEADPIWPLLARLAGRTEGDEPGAGFEPPDEWRMPPDWLRTFEERGEWSYQTSRGRLTCRHPAGFAVLDLNVGPGHRIKDVRERLASESSRYANIAGFARRRVAPAAVRRRGRERSIDRWMGWIAGYLRVRLVRSLGADPAEDLTTLLFARAARVEVSPARLDVFLSLADLPIAIRLAGLDRDPGWVPAAGRTIKFHYD